MATDGEGLAAQPWLVAALGAAAGLIGNVLLSAAQRLLGRAAVQTSLNDGFVDLLEQMRKELKVACAQRDEFKALLASEREAHAAEREAWRQDRLELTGEINQLRAVSQGFERLLRDLGVDLPERRSPAVAPRLVEATLRPEGES